MKDKHARALAIVALVFMGIFLAALIATLADATLLNGGIGYIALCSGVFVFVSMLALKADGRGFSLTKMKNESEMQKIEQALKEQEDGEQADHIEQTSQTEEGDTVDESASDIRETQSSENTD